MIDELKKIIKTLKGNVIAIGINDELSGLIFDNKNVIKFYSLDNSKEKNNSKGRSKIVNIRKLRKKFKKNKNDYLIANINELEKYLKYFIRDSIYITNKKVYLYGKLNSEKLSSLCSKYERYNLNIKLNKYKSYFILEINSKVKSNFFKDKFYFLIDSIDEIIDLITNILIK